MTDEQIASELYSTYCKSVGGKAFNGDALPTWEEFRSDDRKSVQARAWITTAGRARALFTNPTPLKDY